MKTSNDLMLKPPGSLALEVGTGKWPVLPHEVFFGFFMALTWVRLVLAEGFTSNNSLFYLALISANLLLIILSLRNGAKACCYTRLLFYPLALNLIFGSMKAAIPIIHPGKVDLLLQGADRFLVGETLSLHWQGLTHPLLTELFSFFYILFFPYMAFSLVYYLCKDLEAFKVFILGLFTIYGIGFLGYSLMPAEGPYLAMAGQFTVPLKGWWITTWNAEIVRLGSNRVDVFPSLHCAISSYILFLDRRLQPWRFKLYLVPCIGLWISTIYLRYHYLVDVICGFLLSAFALWLTAQYSKRSLKVKLPQPIPYEIHP